VLLVGFITKKIHQPITMYLYLSIFVILPLLPSTF